MRTNGPIQKRDVEFQTMLSRGYVDATIRMGEEMAMDANKVGRQKALLCKKCFYAGAGIAGQAFTDRACGICGTMITYSSTYTDTVCKICAGDHDLCKHCGADRELRPHRRKYAFDTTPAVTAEATQPPMTVFMLPTAPKS